jgi:protease-4
MEYLKKYFVSDTPATQTIEIAPAAPLKVKVGIIHIPDNINFPQLIKTLTEAAKNKELQGLILLIDNNGGDVGQFSTVHDLIKKITTIKPIVGLVCGSAYSCGYMIASATNYLMCSEGSNIGSIGAIIELQKFKDLHLAANPNNHWNATVDVEIWTGGTYKGMSNTNLALTETQRNYLKEFVEKTYQYFINLVARNRNLSIDNHLDWADAKIFMGHEALKLGLVDEIGTLLDAEQKILELIKQKTSDTVFDNTIETVELT